MSTSHSNRSFSYSGQQHQSMLSETDVQTMQRDIDLYTRKMELERKKLYSLNHACHNLKQQVDERNENRKKLLKMQLDPQTKLALSNIATLQQQIAHYNSKYDDTIDEINKVKSQVNQLRRERTAFLEQFNQMENELRTYDDSTTKLFDIIERRKYRAAQTQEQMLDLKTRNEEEQSNYRKQFEQLQRQIQQEKRQKDLLSKSFKIGKTQGFTEFDTGTILKRRLKKLILRNQEKVQIMDGYMRNMTIIDEAFNQIKETTGITDIQEIQNTFIKAEEQNYALLTYVDLLNQEIDNLNDQVLEIESKTVQQQKENTDRQRILLSTPDDQKMRREVLSIIDKKSVGIQNFQDILDKISPDFTKLITRMAQSQFNIKNPHQVFEYHNGIYLNDGTIELYMADLETFVTQLLFYKAKQGNIGNAVTNQLMIEDIPIKDFKQKVVPFANINAEENYALDNSQFIEKNKMKEIAVDTIEKKKIGSMNNTSGGMKKQ